MTKEAAATSPTIVARPIANAHALRDLAQRSWASEAILPDTCPDRRSGWSFRRSGRSSRRSVKPSADPTLVRTRHLPLLPARGSRRDQDHAVRSNAEDQSPAGTAQPAHRCPSRDAWLHPAEGTQHSEARPVPTRQNSQFWMSATSRASHRPQRTERRLRARLHHGPLSHQVIALAATGQLDMAAAGQIRLAVVTSDKSGAVPAVLADERCDPHADGGY